MQEGLDEPGLWAALEGVQALIVRSATQVTQQVLGGGLRCFCHRTHHRVATVGLPGVVVTPHLGASTAEAQDKAGTDIAEQVVLALAGQPVPFAVNQK